MEAADSLPRLLGALRTSEAALDAFLQADAAWRARRDDAARWQTRETARKALVKFWNEKGE